MSNGQRDIILGKIKKALAKPVPQPFFQETENEDWFRKGDDDLAVLFAEKFVELQGQFSWCQNQLELKGQLKQLFEKRKWNKIYCADPLLTPYLDTPVYHDLADCDVAITRCEAMVARTGSLVLSAATPHGRTASVYAPVHICVGFSSQLVPDVGDALTMLRQKYPENLPSLISFASGPSRTADIEKTLVTGVHGPKEVFCFLVDEMETM